MSVTEPAVRHLTASQAPYIRVDLRPWEYALVAQIGAARAARNHNRPDAKHYDRSRMEDDRTAQHASCAAECATARAFDRYWTAGGAWDSGDHARYKDLADVGQNIEVRRIREPSSTTFAVDERDRDRIVVACYVEPPELQVVRVFGWARGADALAAGEVAEKYPSRRRVPLSVLSLKGVIGKVVLP